ncbi:MAG: MTH938/NDUFAF3 family protein [Patescibacteria group bacterium]|nr:MTH938/NDUFAF3 family protein [Patescibacteria group bacterium]
MVAIEKYYFGSITIDGKTYTHDVEVRWSGEVLDWWRKESHLVDVEDVERALAYDPEVIIIGTGQSGVAKATERAEKEIEKRRIKLIIEITGEAIKTFNLIQKESEKKGGKKTKLIGLFHLTC